MLAPATKPHEGTVPAAVAEKKGEHLEDSDLDEEMIGQPLWWRLLVTYLPWLQPVATWWQCRNQPPTPGGAHPSSVPGEKLERLNSQESDLERGESSDGGRRNTWGTENTLHMNPTDEGSTNVDVGSSAERD